MNDENVPFLRADALDEEDLFNSYQEREPSKETGLVSEDADPAPVSTASKADWIHYAISRGEDRDVAVNTSLEELITKYGPPSEPAEPVAVPEVTYEPYENGQGGWSFRPVQR